MTILLIWLLGSLMVWAYYLLTSNFSFDTKKEILNFIGLLIASLPLTLILSVIGGLIFISIILKYSWNEIEAAPTNLLKLEDFKKYVRRDGEISGPLMQSAITGVFYDSVHRIEYTVNGRVFPDLFTKNEKDIIAEYHEH